MNNIIEKFTAGLFMALSFLTSFPSKVVPWDGETTRYSLYFFPVCGLFIGIAAAGVTLIFNQWFLLPDYIIAFVILVSMLLFYGGLHLDGWMDVSDAVGSWRDKEKRLEIMKDSHVGSTAVWSTILLLSGRFISILFIVENATTGLLFLVIFIPVLSRTWMGHLIISTPLAKKEGLAAWFQQHANKRDSNYIFAMTIMIILVLLIIYPQMSGISAVLITVSFVSYLFSRHLFCRLFGGINGDMAGAWMEGGETILWMSSVLFYSFVMV